MDERDRISAKKIPINNADINNVNAIPAGAPSSGKLSVCPVPNKSMADRLNLAPQPNLRICGDSTDIDIQKVRKHMKSGAKRNSGEFVTRQATWPEKMLSLNAPGRGKKVHNDLTFAEFIDGMIAKFLTETEADILDRDLSNKLTYLRELVAMQYSLDFKHVLAINHRFLLGWENEHFHWNDWSRIDAYLKEARMQAIFSSVGSRQNGGGGGGGGSGAPGAPKAAAAFVYGVPREFLTKNSLCIKWNKGECEEAGHHKFATTNTTLYHKCAACKKSGKTPEKEHAVRDCESNSFLKKKSFRQ